MLISMLKSEYSHEFMLYLSESKVLIIKLNYRLFYICSTVN